MYVGTFVRTYVAGSQRGLYVNIDKGKWMDGWMDGWLDVPFVSFPSPLHRIRTEAKDERVAGRQKGVIFASSDPVLFFVCLLAI